MTAPRSIIAFDCEVTAWPGTLERFWRGADEEPELVQLGAVAVERGTPWREVAHLEVLVRPVFFPRLSDYFTDLTGITQAAVDAHGIPFAEALARFADFVDGADLVVSFGGDEAYLHRNCALHRMAWPLAGVAFRNVAPLLIRAVGGGEPVSSGALPRLLGFTVPGAAHDALHDARAVAGALSRLEAAGRITVAQLAAKNVDPGMWRLLSEGGPNGETA